MSSTSVWGICGLQFGASLKQYPYLKHCSPPQGITDTELQVILVVPCDKTFYETSVLLCKNSLQLKMACWAEAFNNLINGSLFWDITVSALWEKDLLFSDKKFPLNDFIAWSPIKEMKMIYLHCVLFSLLSKKLKKLSQKLSERLNNISKQNLQFG